MDRRSFVASGLATAASLHTDALHAVLLPGQQQIRDLFPRLRDEVFLNAAGGTPLGTFAGQGLERYGDFWRLGPDDGRAAYFNEMMAGIRGLFADLVGANASEIALVQSTKAGEQIAIDCLANIRNGGNIVTNDMHFSGSLHNYELLRRSGVDVRVVRAENWDVQLPAMAAAIDDRTALVSVSLVSNINGRVEPVTELAGMAHRHGALLYADIIQAAGILPMDLHSTGIDIAATNGYKWLFGPHGCGFLYVRDDVQGRALEDHVFPGNARRNYRPWTDDVDDGVGPIVVQPRTDARRYEPGHPCYLGYCALFEGLKFLQRVGIANARAHSVRLASRLRDQLDPARYRSISTHAEQTPIATFLGPGAAVLEPRLREARIVIGLDGRQIRVSPAIYNDESDIDRLASVLNDVPA